MAAGEGGDVRFAPSVEELSPDGFSTWVDPGETGAEGASRPGHVRGVATVCVKLFNIVRPQRAYFGQKDAQQAAVLRRVVRDLNLDIELRVLPTVRDKDGLAISSRNVRLSPEERTPALALPRALARGAEVYTRGGDPVRTPPSSFHRAHPASHQLFPLRHATLTPPSISIPPPAF